MQCPDCESFFVERRGRRNNKQRYECQERDCGKWFSVDLTTEELVEQKFIAPKIFIFDIEVTPLEVFSWGIHKQHINKNQIIEDKNMISWAGKYLYHSDIYSDVQTSKEAKNRNDKRIVSSLYHHLDNADIVITYNGNNFDLPFFYTRCLIHNFYPPKPFKSVDIYATISRKFSFTSNSLEYVNKSLKLSEKMSNSGLSMWKNVLQGNQSALDEMISYNIQDVISLEDTYLTVRPWIQNHPNIGLWHDSNDPLCPYCGSFNRTLKDKKIYLGSGCYNIYRCNDCNGIHRDRVNQLSKDKKKSLTSH